MRFTVEKPKLPKGFSYVLKTSILQEVIGIAELDLNINLHYWHPQRIPIGETILECYYWLPNERVDYDRFYIRAGTVKSQERKLAETFLKTEVLPKFVNWIKELKSLPENSTKLKHNLYFNAIFKENKIIYQQII